MEAIEYRQIAFSGNAEDMGDTLGEQAFNQEMAGDLGRGSRHSA
jgi:hypothetical protein